MSSRRCSGAAGTSEVANIRSDRRDVVVCGDATDKLMLMLTARCRRENEQKVQSAGRCSWTTRVKHELSMCSSRGVKLSLADDDRVLGVRVSGPRVATGHDR